MKWCERCQCYHRDQPVTPEECIAPAVADVTQAIDTAVISELLRTIPNTRPPVMRYEPFSEQG